MDEKPTAGSAAPKVDSGPDTGRKMTSRRAFADLPPAAQRALKEAEERRKSSASENKKPKEIGGRGGEDPTRYGDWEIDGRAVDF